MPKIGYSDIRYSEKFIYKMQQERLKTFELQDPANQHFDVTFEIDGKKLYANKFMLTSVSETLKAMISDRWTKKDEVITIETHSYDNFYQFIRFLYTGGCNLTNKNVFKITDMAEFYAVPSLKEFCDKFLIKMKYNVETVEEMVEFSEKYSLNKMKGVFYVCQISIKNNGKVIVGVFRDSLNIRRAIEQKNKYSIYSIQCQSTTLLRLLELKFKIPKTASKLKKMDGIEWYLCLDKNGFLTFKHHSKVDENDYLFAEMKSEKEFSITPYTKTFISACINNI